MYEFNFNGVSFRWCFFDFVVVVVASKATWGLWIDLVQCNGTGCGWARQNTACILVVNKIAFCAYIRPSMKFMKMSDAFISRIENGLQSFVAYSMEYCFQWKKRKNIEISHRIILNVLFLHLNQIATSLNLKFIENVRLVFSCSMFMRTS